MSKNLLLEIGTEEMPANIMSGVVDQLKALAASQFEAHRIAAENITIYATPRRLAVLVKGAADRQPDEEVKKRGPSIKAAFDADGNPTRAAQGFARGQHIDPSELVKEGEYTWAHVVHAGKKVEDVLPELFLSLITGLNFTRSMRWADEEAHFIRPVRWIVALCDKEIIPMEFAHVKSGNVSRGHRFLCKEPVVISDPLSYKETMREAFVIVDQDERREMIRTGLLAVADKLGGHVWHNADLLEEINYLVEYPTPLYGRIDDEFLKLPVPAVVTPMRDHQRYYPVRNEDGSLMPYFLTVRNGGTKALENVQHGNEKVLRARLDDAKFFFENDRKKTLEGHRDDLTRINYQEGMGDMRDKADRLQKLTEAIGKDWGFTAEEAADADRAAFLSKSDLATGMVTEFTELQGEMGKEYALLDGEKPEVAQAIFEQYMPRFAGDILPDIIAVGENAFRLKLQPDRLPLRQRGQELRAELFQRLPPFGEHAFAALLPFVQPKAGIDHGNSGGFDRLGEYPLFPHEVRQRIDIIAPLCRVGLIADGSTHILVEPADSLLGVVPVKGALVLEFQVLRRIVSPDACAPGAHAFTPLSA